MKSEEDINSYLDLLRLLYIGICRWEYEKASGIQIWNLEEESILKKEICMEVRNEDEASREETVK